VQGGFEAEQIFYLIKKIIQSGRKFIGFDLDEIGVGETDWMPTWGARVLWKLCNLLVAVIPNMRYQYVVILKREKRTND